VAGVALSLVGYLIAFHVFDAVQGVVAFVLRAYKIAVVPAVIFAVALWGLGLAGGYVVAFHPVLGAPRGAAGMWLMQAVAPALRSVLLVAAYLVCWRSGAPAAATAPASQANRPSGSEARNREAQMAPSARSIARSSGPRPSQSR
jgi:MATE family multidrug resistance protein